jgi:hypothetical protein
MRKQQIIIEPIMIRSVQSIVGRLKSIIVVSLLLALWLAGSVNCPLESPAFALPGNCCAAGNSTGGAAPIPENSCCPLDDGVRCQLRRSGGTRGQAAPQSLEPVSADISNPPGSISPAIRPAGDAFLLQQRWQFVWRTADPPRAPSFFV